MPTPNDCSLSALICDDQNATITRFQEQKGYITNFIYEGISSADPLIYLLEKTKKEFPAGQGDSLTRGVLQVTGPNELDGLNWNPVKSNFPGNSACCNTYRTFDYGSRTVHGCLSQIGYRSPRFCKTDVIFKHQWVDQLMQIVMIMRNVSVGVWSNWLRASYQKSVTCTILSQQWGHPEAHGEYPSAPRPTTHINLAHLDMLNDRMRTVGGLIGSPIRGFQTIVMGRGAFMRMRDRQMELEASLYGYRSSERVMATYQEFVDSKLGKVITWSGYAFILVDKPRRFRNKTSSESWDDALVPSTVNTPTDVGVKTSRNNDYYNPNIVVGEETLWLNQEAVDWLVPPSALIKSISAGGKEWFPATNYAGDFEAVYCPDDPKRKTVMFEADFMGGMMSMFPEKGRAIMHLPVFSNACDDDDNACAAIMPSLSLDRSIRSVCINDTPGQLQVLIEGELPEQCPPGNSLFIVSEKGKKFLIGSIVSTWAFNGNSQFPQPGNYYVIQLATGLESAAVVRDLCDPWKSISCMPNETVSDDPFISPCGVCNSDTGEPDTTCVLTAIITTDRIRGIDLADGTNTIAETNYTSAATLQTALQNWLNSNGGGTAVVTGGNVDSGFEWTIQVTGAPVLDEGEVLYDDGLAVDNTGPFNRAKFSKSGVCTAT